jgi:hypothetical protein
MVRCVRGAVRGADWYGSKRAEVDGHLPEGADRGEQGPVGRPVEAGRGGQHRGEDKFFAIRCKTGEGR